MCNESEREEIDKVIVEAEKSLLVVLSQPKGKLVLEETAKQNQCVWLCQCYIAANDACA